MPGEIRSNGARVVIEDGKTRFEQAAVGIHGTLVRITLDCDASLFEDAGTGDADLEL